MSSAGEILFEKEYPSELNLVPEIQNEVKKAIKKFVPTERLDAIILGVSEAVYNSIKHGNKSDRKKKIFILIEKDEETITISILDEGEGFDFSKIPDPTESENILKESGRGIFIIRNVVDNLNYEFTEHGTKTILTVKL